MSMNRTPERGVPHAEALSNTLAKSIRCAIQNGLSLHDINGHAEEWCNHLRNRHGHRPSTDDFFAEWEKQITELSRKPVGMIDDE